MSDSTSDVNFVEPTVSINALGTLKLQNALGGGVKIDQMGNVKVASWSGTAPSGGYSTNATVFKWQKEWVDVRGILGDGINAPNHKDKAVNFTLRINDASQGATVWLDDLNASGPYMTASGDEKVKSTAQRYFEYRVIFSTWGGTTASPEVSQVVLSYTSSGPTTAQVMRHGKWFSGGVEQRLFWGGSP